MVTFFIALAALILGFAVYAKVVERLLPPDERKTPAIDHPDGVDYIPLPLWKSFLIQLLNIAGLGPIFGALSGALWGPVVYFWIVLGTIFAGGVHDYFSGMLSERHNGSSISEIVGVYLGPVMQTVMRVFSVVLLVFVGATFSIGPAGLLALLTPEALDMHFWLAVILVYYFLATLLPIDKIIGRLYPLFGAALIIMCLGVGGGMVAQGYEMPEMWHSFGNLHPQGLPIWPLMFITVACGAISGFHATQSPMMARCIRNEYEGRKVFYGAMVARYRAHLGRGGRDGLQRHGRAVGGDDAPRRAVGARLRHLPHAARPGRRGARDARRHRLPDYVGGHGLPLCASDARGLVRRGPEAALEASDALSAAAALRRRAVADKFPDYLALFLVVEPDARDDYAVDGGGLPRARAS